MIIKEKWYLVYGGNKIIAKGFHTGEVSSNSTIEIFDTESELNDRVEELNLTDTE